MQSKITSELLTQAKRIVVKVGSSLVTDEGRGLDAQAIGLWCEQMAQLPAHVRWKADNYNHLMEQPTIFYAISIALAVLPAAAPAAVMWAWAYVALRVLHSFAQALGNKIQVRFVLFVLSNIPLVALTYLAAVAYLARLGGS